ncbi:gamma-glutamyl-gamma-aminobutyrate hydrolase family protein [Devosia sp. BK]|uniref:type 1 glutamine amidotransferase n=1 Tax=Devosia sp. BK TaxID=2871706 RepID=UPI00293B5E15|nr:gamma-glutamyl-gamma-aminobutyrate hydrolase family protein [Devosia sp. BK]MDV3253229.1 gamma-glutamyl-gamma-aminobutyrate hydrolase family protein [Devosia sp. BK]
MRITIIETGYVPEALRPEYGSYPKMFERMLGSTGDDFSFDVIAVDDNGMLPDPAQLDAILITGSPAGVYEDHAWLPPLRDFIRKAYAAQIPMLGVCFGHQIMADALGGRVEKSHKGWGLGRHTYEVKARPGFMPDAPETLSIACSHQDQVVEAPTEAEVILGSDFTPNAGLLYKTGKALSFQPHPEFVDSYAEALVDLRRGIAPDAVVETGFKSFDKQSDSSRVANYIGAFFRNNAS